jgi:hypothetical protein
MTIDQRNAGASVTPVNTQYLLDRWAATLTQTSKYTVQQNAGAVTPPTGFINYLGVTSSSAYSISAGDVFAVRQQIEGYNVADLGWGTVNAQTITLSFWVRSSLTGTFGAGLTNNGATRNYPFTYLISSANTWEYKTITVAGDTTGTWLTDNGSGILLYFGLGAGSSFSSTANAWNGTTNAFIPTGAVSVVGTNGATFYITGVQLEKGSTATPFEFRSIGQELALCQRYYEVAYILGGMPVTITHAFTSGAAYGVYPFKVEKRATPTGSSSGSFIALTANGGAAGGSLLFAAMSVSVARIDITGASGLVAGSASSVWGDTNPRIAFSSEL